MIRLAALTAVTMVAFAANSLLNRMALDDGQTGPAAFAVIRVVSGALCLWLLVRMRSGSASPVLRPWGAGSLALYMLGFSFAYVTLPAGMGALILFGGVQVTMFAGAVLGGERVAWTRWAGAVIAFGGLVWLLWPGAQAAPPPVGAALMLAAALGWGIYSLLGRGVPDPLAATASNFVYAAPLALLVFAVLPDAASLRGIVLAVLSGAVTSGLGYALWYSVLPRLTATLAAVAQLSVPVIAMAGGVLLLNEALSARFVAATVLVLGGISLSLVRPGYRRIGSSGS
jgi:drug/metabolite transporter (DMT)-like permease